MKHRKRKGDRLSRSRVGLSDYISSLQQWFNSLGLDRESVYVTHVSQSVEEPWLQSQRLELLGQLLFITRAWETHKDLTTWRVLSPYSSVPGAISEYKDRRLAPSIVYDRKDSGWLGVQGRSVTAVPFFSSRAGMSLQRGSHGGVPKPGAGACDLRKRSSYSIRIACYSCPYRTLRIWSIQNTVSLELKSVLGFKPVPRRPGCSEHCCPREG